MGGEKVLKSRQFELLIYLLKYRKSTYGELAELLAVSKKTIERDIDRLSGIGIPIYCTQGIGGGVYLDEKYQFASSFFTPEEIHHIILALSVADSFTVTQRKGAIIQKLCLLDSSLTTLVERDMQDYLSIDLVDAPIDTDTEICKVINYCLDEQVLAQVDGISNVACLEYVLKRDGLYLFAHAQDYILLKVTEITTIEPTEVEFDRSFLSYSQFRKNSR